MAEDEDYARVLTNLAARFQNNDLVRKLVGVSIIAIFLAACGYFVYDLLPRRHGMTISGGEITGNRHYLAKVLQEEARAKGVDLKIVPTHGSIEVLEKLESGELDLAFSQGGLEPNYANIVHVATIAPELIHFIVKPEIETIRDLRGKIVNLGSKSGGTRVVAGEILRIAGLEPDIDYAETNYGNEQLITMRPDRLPDVVVNVSFLPSFIADFLVKERGYTLLEIPFPSALALRMGWVADSVVPGYTYDAQPPVPPTDIKTIGVNLHLLANERVPARAIEAVLEVLYGAPVASRTRMPLDEDDIALPSGFPLSEGTVDFAARHEPVLSGELMDQLKAAAGLVFSLASGLIVAVRWFRGKPIQAVRHDDEIKRAIAEVAAIERRADVTEAAELGELGARLGLIRASILERMEGLDLSDPSLIGTFLAVESGARERLDRAMARAGIS